MIGSTSSPHGSRLLFTPTQLEELSAFAPAILRNAVAGDDPEWTASRDRRLTGAALFVDLVGFSRLTSELDAGSLEGTETLSGVLDALFRQMMSLIIDAGGDIVAIAGDAVMAIWPCAAPRLRDAAALATFAAQRLQTELRFPRLPAHQRLQVRAAVGVGDVRLALLEGTGTQQLSLVYGSAIADATRSDLGGPGDVCISSAAAGLLHRDIDTTAHRQGSRILRRWDPAFVPPALPTMSAPRVVPGIERFVGLPIRTRVASDAVGSLTEFRHATIAFLHFPDFDHDSDDAPARVRTMAGPALEAIVRHEGTAQAFLMDDKGLTLMAAFGLPPQSHDDDAARACRAVEEASHALSARGIELHAGIATGRLFCGVVGNSDRRHYGVVGPAANLAARFASEHRGLFAGEKTRLAASSLVSFTPAGALRLKGFAETVPAYRFSTTSTVASLSVGTDRPSAPLIGRAAELRSLDEALDLASGRSATLWITGSAGVGKSRLAAELEAKARARGWRHLAVRAQPGGRSRPLDPWLAALRDLRARGSDSVTDLAALVGQPTAGVTEQDDTVAAGNLQRLVADWIRNALGTQGAVIVLDNADDVDTASWGVLDHLLLDSTDVLIGIVCRKRPDDALPPALRHHLEQLPAVALPLLPLTPADGIRIAAATLGVEDLPERVAALVARQAGGYPLYAELVARQLRETGIVRVVAGRCLISMAHETAPEDVESAFQTPDESHTLQALITSRIDALGPSVQVTLKCAAVCGYEFPAAGIEAVHPDRPSAATLADHLVALRADDFIRATDAPGVYAFSHKSIQDVAYAMLPFQTRIPLHTGVATWLTETQPESHAELAYHWKHARQPARAATHFGDAGLAAHHAGAYPEAVAYLRDALESRTDTHQDRQERAVWERTLGKAYVAWSRYPDGRQHLLTALALEGVRAPRTAVGAGVWLMAALAGRLLPRRPYAEESQRQWARVQSQTLEALMEIFFLSDESVKCLLCALRGLALAERAGPSPELARALSSTASIVGFIPWERKAEELAVRAQAIASQVNSDSSRVWVNLSVGVLRLGRGQWAEASRLFDDALRVAQAIGDDRRACDVRVSQGNLALLRGRSESIAEITDYLHRNGEGRADWRLVGGALAIRGFAEARGEQWTALKATASELAEIRTRDFGVSAHEQHVDLLLFDAYVAVHEERWSDAQDVVDRATRILSSSTVSQWDLAVHLLHATDLCRLIAARRPSPSAGADMQRAVRRLRRPLRAFRRIFPVGEPALAYWHAVTSEMAGRIDRAQHHWNLCLQAAERLDMRHEATLARRALATHR